MDYLTWDLDQLASALKLSKEDTLAYFKDGRRISFIIERRIANEVLHGSMAENEGASFDIYDSAKGKWEIRSISKDGIYFCPSYMVGSGRNFNLQGFLKKNKRNRWVYYF